MELGNPLYLSTGDVLPPRGEYLSEGARVNCEGSYRYGGERGRKKRRQACNASDRLPDLASFERNADIRPVNQPK
jgi:hypothetical protein